jgi:hypothetical protein
LGFLPLPSSEGGPGGLGSSGRQTVTSRRCRAAGEVTKFLPHSVQRLGCYAHPHDPVPPEEIVAEDSGSLIVRQEALGHAHPQTTRVYERDEIQVVERAGLAVVGIVTMGDLERLDPEKVRELPQVAASAKRELAAEQMRAFLKRYLINGTGKRK